MSSDLQKIIDKIDAARTKFYNRPNEYKLETLHSKIDGHLKSAMGLMAQMIEQERIASCPFQPNMKVKIIGHKGMPVVFQHDRGMLNSHMEFCCIKLGGYEIRGTLVFDHDGRVVGYEKLGTMLKKDDSK